MSNLFVIVGIGGIIVAFLSIAYYFKVVLWERREMKKRKEKEKEWKTFFDTKKFRERSK